MIEDFYGLTGKPFQLTPDPAFYFESATHRKALSYLGYGLAQAEGFIVITGEVGAGKSTLVAHMLATIDPATLTAGLVVTSKLDGEELIHVAAQAFGLAVHGHDKAFALGAIENFLHEEARAGRRCLLVVDEAQNLSIEALEEMRMLSNFQLGAHPLLQTLLLGQPEFRETLNHHLGLEQLRQRVIATHHLEAMRSDEIRSYIEHRLRRVGWEGRPGFDEAIFTALHAASGGVPRRINQIVSRLLLLGAIERRESIEAAMLPPVLAELGADGPAAARPRDVMPPLLEGEAKHDADTTANAEILAALAQRDAQIVELQQAVIELANQGGAGRSIDLAAFGERITEFEARLAEQDSAIRHTLTMRNALSVDVEDWFQVGAFETVIARSDWSSLVSRVESNCDMILDMFAEAQVQATFFTLGWVAKRHPALMRRIVDAGHEIASHGWDHARVFRMDAGEFARDLELSRKVIEDAAGLPVRGYRAPSFSIDQRTPWAYAVLAEQGFAYSSSVAPIAHDHYGWREAPRFAFRPLQGSDLVEIPVTTASFAGRRLAAGGGGFFRVLPYGFSRWAIRQVNRREGRPAVFYFHPWEIDPDQPRVPDAPLKSRVRHYTKLGAMAGKLRQLIRQFDWGRMDQVVANEAPRTVALTT